MDITTTHLRKTKQITFEYIKNFPSLDHLYKLWNLHVAWRRENRPWNFHFHHKKNDGVASILNFVCEMTFSIIICAFAYNAHQARKTSTISTHYPSATTRTIILVEILILAYATALERIIGSSRT